MERGVGEVLPCPWPAGEAEQSGRDPCGLGGQGGGDDGGAAREVQHTHSSGPRHEDKVCATVAQQSSASVGVV